MNVTVNASLDEDVGVAGGTLTVDLRALRDNYSNLVRRSAQAITAAVVKADAYGLGAAQVSRVLYADGCRTFFVAHFVEAVRLRPTLPRDAAIYVLNGLQPGNEAIAAKAGVVPILNSAVQARNWLATARTLDITLPAAIQADTGMSRLGMAEQEVAEVLRLPGFRERLEIKYLLSHLACADDHTNVLNQKQLEAMSRVAAMLPDIPVSFANSGGIFLGGDYLGALTRPGISLYGGAATSGHPNAMKPVVRLGVRVIQVRTVPAGTAVGYGGAHVTAREARLATISAGYADGLPRNLGNGGAAYYGDIRLPIVGRVSMDSLSIDVTSLPANTLSLGSQVELIGPHQSLEQIADAADTISYEILTRLGQRYRRNYIQS
ncbi:alanine racemase [Rhizobium giardinii]|uniref:alanine racemase n=1 Tax=Rhizobium giardinii TaxID=56731 RepID=UPI000DD73632